MSKRLYSHRYVKYWYAYDIDDICALFSKTGLHPQTVRSWIKRGLKVIGAGRPTLIYGNDLILYLKEQNAKGKIKTAFNEMFCMKCKDASGLFQRKVTVEHKVKTLHVSGHCRSCKTAMFKTYKMDDYSEIKRSFNVVGVLELYDCEVSPCKTHLQQPIAEQLSESEYGAHYGDLFG